MEFDDIIYYDYRNQTFFSRVQSVRNFNSKKFLAVNLLFIYSVAASNSHIMHLVFHDILNIIIIFTDRTPKARNHISWARRFQIQYSQQANAFPEPMVPNRRRTNSGTNVDSLSIRPSGTHLGEIWIKLKYFHYGKCVWKVFVKMTTIFWRAECVDLWRPFIIKALRLYHTHHISVLIVEL